MNFNELDSFSLHDAVRFHDELNPELFAGDRLKPQVHDQLLLIAQDFVDHLGINDLEVQDITLSGSNAAYSYTKHSDIDLHILVDMNKFNDDPVYREFFDAKKTIYNDTHSITIGGIDVELYVQDSNEPVISLGEYSILRDSWIKLPRQRKAHISQVATKNKYRKLYKLAEYAMRSSDSDKIKYVLKTIKKYRQAGLDEGGEFSPENLAFKILRKKGIISRLYGKLQTLHDKKLSLPESVNKAFLYSPKAISQTVKLGGYIFRVQNTLNGFDDIPGMFITAYDPKLPQNEQIVGTAELVLHKDKKDSWLESDDTMVDDDHQGKGIAAMMYAVAKSLGCDVRPSMYQSNDGRAMWSKWGSDAEHLMREASGYIPSEKQKNDPRWKTALTVDITPYTMQQNARKLGSKIKRDGTPPTLHP